MSAELCVHTKQMVDLWTREISGIGIVVVGGGILAVEYVT